MAKEELFTNSFGAKLFTALGGIPVDVRVGERPRRDEGDPGRARGGRARGACTPRAPAATVPTSAELFDGTAYLAVKLGIPIVPVGIGGSEEILASGKKLPRLHKVSVKVGAPIVPPADASTRKRSDLVAISDELMKSLQSLFDDARAEAGCTP